MGLRKGKSYRKVKRAYTRTSKYKKYSFVKSKPANKISKYDMGDPKKTYSHAVSLVSKERVQIRHNAIEAARLVIFRRLTKFLGNDYFFKVRLYPHHVLRENKMIAGAGADRLQKGMQKAFGRPTGLAAQISVKQRIFTIFTNENNLDMVKESIWKACPRLPGTYSIEIKKRE